MTPEGRKKEIEMYLLESFFQFEVLTHIKNRFLPKSLAGVVYTCAKESSLYHLFKFVHPLMDVWNSFHMFVWTYGSRTVDSALSLVCFTSMLYRDKMLSPVKFDFVPLNSPMFSEWTSYALPYTSVLESVFGCCLLYIDVLKNDIASRSLTGMTKSQNYHREVHSIK